MLVVHFASLGVRFSSHFGQRNARNMLESTFFFALFEVLCLVVRKMNSFGMVLDQIRALCLG